MALLLANIPSFSDDLNSLLLSPDMTSVYDSDIISKLQEAYSFLNESRVALEQKELLTRDFSGTNLSIGLEYVSSDKISIRGSSIKIVNSENGDYKGALSRLNATSSLSGFFWRKGEYVQILNYAVPSAQEDYILSKENIINLLILKNSDSQILVGPKGTVYSDILHENLKDRSGVAYDTLDASFIKIGVPISLSNYAVSTKSVKITNSSLIFNDIVVFDTATYLNSCSIGYGGTSVLEATKLYLGKDGIALNTGYIPKVSNLITNFRVVYILDSMYMKKYNFISPLSLKREGDIPDEKIDGMANDIVSNTFTDDNYSRKPMTRKEVEALIGILEGKLLEVIGECI